MVTSESEQLSGYADRARQVIEVGGEDDPFQNIDYAEFEQRLLTPVPSFDALRAKKKAEGYGHLPIDEQDERFHEPLVSSKEYGLKGQSYYSRKNELFEDGLPGVPKEVSLRKSLMEKLVSANHLLKHPYFTQFFGGEVELFLHEGLRSYETQRRLHEEAFPEHIAQHNPDWTLEQVLARRDDVIAKPSKTSPHASGGAIDLEIRFVDPNPDFDLNLMVDFAHEDGDLSETITPDYFENLPDLTDKQLLARNNRRALYNLLTGVLEGNDTNLRPNPHEYWHYDLGNQLWSLGTGKTAFYGSPSD